MSEYELEKENQEKEDTADYIEIEYLEISENTSIEKTYSISDEDKAKIIDIYHKQKVKKAAKDAQNKAIIQNTICIFI